MCPYLHPFPDRLGTRGNKSLPPSTSTTHILHAPVGERSFMEHNEGILCPLDLRADIMVSPLRAFIILLLTSILDYHFQLFTAFKLFNIDRTEFANIITYSASGTFLFNNEKRVMFCSYYRRFRAFRGTSSTPRTLVHVNVEQP
jgi:hypothetical protein